jgi:hypothetical protein
MWLLVRRGSAEHPSRRACELAKVFPINSAATVSVTNTATNTVTATAAPPGASYPLGCRSTPMAATPTSPTKIPVDRAGCVGDQHCHQHRHRHHAGRCADGERRLCTTWVGRHGDKEPTRRPYQRSQSRIRWSLTDSRDTGRPPRRPCASATPAILHETNDPAWIRTPLRDRQHRIRVDLGEVPRRGKVTVRPRRGESSRSPDSVDVHATTYQPRPREQCGAI